MIDIDVPDGTSGVWKVETYTIGDSPREFINLLTHGRYVPPGTYKRLLRGHTCVMSNTPDEIRDFSRILYQSKGSILVNGLGLGVFLKALLAKDAVTDITVIEKSEDVIKLVAPTYLQDN